MIAGTTGSLLGKRKNIKRRDKCKIDEPLLADFLSCLPCLQTIGYILIEEVHQACLHLRRRNGASFFSVRVSLNERNYRFQSNYANYWHHVLYVSERPNHVTANLKETFFLAVRISHLLQFFLLFSFVIRISFIRNFLSAF